MKRYSMPVSFFFLSLIFYFLSGLPVSFVAMDFVERFGRNLLLVASLVLPVMAGMGINFALMLGAMAGQLSLLFVSAFSIEGLPAVGAAMVLAMPLAVFAGVATGLCYYRTAGREMITGLVLGYFASGIYQFILLNLGVGAVVDLSGIQYSLDNFPFLFRIGMVKIPAATLLLSLFLCFLLFYLQKTPFGQQIRMVGDNSETAEKLGVPVKKIKLWVIVVSMLLGAWGQIISLQNLGTMNTYASHEQVGLYAAAALFAGGATTKNAKAVHALIGCGLFYFLFITAPKAGTVLFQNAQIGEYFRVLTAYGVLAIALMRRK